MDIHEIQERSAMIQQPIEYFSDILFNSLDSFLPEASIGLRVLSLPASV